MSKFRDKALTFIFIVILAAALTGFFLLPKAEISENEKRTLAIAPKFTIENVLNGKFEKDTEAYFSDHFPFRNELTAVNAYVQLYTGRNGTSSGIIKGKDGYLITEPTKLDYKQLDVNLGAMIEFTQNTGIPSTLMLVPSTGHIMSEKLPKNHPEYKDREIIDYIRNVSGAVIGYVDLEEPFMKAKEETQIYYRTDHHWTAEGAYNAYVAYCREIGYEPMWEFDVSEHEGFRGTSYSKSALWNEGSDTIELWNYPYDISINIDGDKNVSNQMYFMRHLSAADKYPVYLDGNHAKTEIINNGNLDGQKLLVIKDSFANSVVPFIANHYSQVDMVDLRYYRDTLSAEAIEKGYDRVLFLYGISTLAELNDISALE